MDFFIKLLMGVLAAFALAIWLGPKEPGEETHPFFSVLVGFIVGIVAFIIFAPSP
jgi:hypothetical protein